MTLKVWGRGLLLWGLLAALASALPLLLMQVLPEAAGAGFFGLVAIMLGLSVVPLALVVASVGALLLLLAMVRRDRL